MASPLVYIILLNYNGYKDTIECVKSLEKIKYDNYKVVIVDNCSTDKSEEILRKECKEHIFIQSGNNLGFAGGNNVGIKFALEKGADYVCLLNNDTIVDQNFLEPLVDIAESYPKCGVVGGKIYFYNEPKKIWYAGAKINKYTGKTKHLGLNEFDSIESNTVKETVYITGCLMLISSKVIRDVGSMDESYFLYLEEVDWCINIKKKGYKLVYQPKSVVYHKVSSAVKKESNLEMYYYLRNKVYFIRKNYGILCKTSIFFFIHYQILKYLIKFLLRKDFIAIRVVLKAYEDILKNVKGKLELINN